MVRYGEVLAAKAAAMGMTMASTAQKNRRSMVIAFVRSRVFVVDVLQTDGYTQPGRLANRSGTQKKRTPREDQEVSETRLVGWFGWW